MFRLFVESCEDHVIKECFGLLIHLHALCYINFSTVRSCLVGGLCVCRFVLAVERRRVFFYFNLLLLPQKAILAAFAPAFLAVVDKGIALPLYPQLEITEAVIDLTFYVDPPLAVVIFALNPL
jgi:hypothetical protein